MKRALFGILFVVAAAATALAGDGSGTGGGGGGGGGGEKKWKNLKVLPAKITKSELKKLMEAYNGELGVECEFCHESGNMAGETKKKELSREMMRMTTEINKKLRALAGPKYEDVSCGTCHRGDKEPKKFVPPPPKEGE